MATTRRRIVITGAGIITALGDLQKTADAVAQGISGIGDVPSDDPLYQTCYFPKGGFINGHDLARWFDKRIADSISKRSSRPAQFARIALHQAVTQTQLPLEDGVLAKKLGRRTGTFIGTGAGAARDLAEIALYCLAETLQLSNEQRKELRLATTKREFAFSAVKGLPDAPAFQAARAYKSLGCSGNGTKACATALGNWAWAFDKIALGKIDIAFTGATEELTPWYVKAFEMLGSGAISRSGVSQPFNGDHDGFVPAEGAGIVVMEALEHALDRGAPIWAEVLGYGELDDEEGRETNPDTNSQIEVMELALKDAGIAPSEVQLVKAHATSTPKPKGADYSADGSELLAIRSVFGTQPYIWAPKKQIGHTLGASGSIEGILALEMARRGIVPPTGPLPKPIPEVSTNGYSMRIPAEPLRTEIQTVLVNALGFGGQNVCFVLKKWQE